MASPVQEMQRTVAAMSTDRESPIGLPMSRVSSRASSSACSCTSCASFTITRLRCAGRVFDQRPSSKALRATATARFTSSAPQSATFASRRPSIGLWQSKVAPPAAST